MAETSSGQLKQGKPGRSARAELPELGEEVGYEDSLGSDVQSLLDMDLEEGKGEARESGVQSWVVEHQGKGTKRMKKINPFILTTTLANKIGEILYAKVLNDGNLLVRCVDEEQLEKALSLKEIGKAKVESTRRGRVQRGNNRCAVGSKYGGT